MKKIYKQPYFNMEILPAVDVLGVSGDYMEPFTFPSTESNETGI